jgi:hypothetical protein
MTQERRRVAPPLVAPPQTTPAVRGATDESLARPAADYLGSLRWDGAPHDPDTVSAGEFLARL